MRVLARCHFPKFNLRKRENSIGSIFYVIIKMMDSVIFWWKCLCRGWRNNFLVNLFGLEYGQEIMMRKPSISNTISRKSVNGTIKSENTKDIVSSCEETILHPRFLSRHFHSTLIVLTPFLYILHDYECAIRTLFILCTNSRLCFSIQSSLLKLIFFSRTELTIAWVKNPREGVSREALSFSHLFEKWIEKIQDDRQGCATNGWDC